MRKTLEVLFSLYPMIDPEMQYALLAKADAMDKKSADDRLRDCSPDDNSISCEPCLTTIEHD